MNRKLITSFVAALLLAGKPASVLACAACYGQSDSAMAQGMNWGIFSLLGMAALVLGSLGTFFVFLAKRAPMTDDPQVVDKDEQHSDNEHGTL